MNALTIIFAAVTGNNLLTILVILVVVGVILYCVNAFIPMQATIKKIINIAAVVLVIIWLLNIVGAFDYLREVNF